VIFSVDLLDVFDFVDLVDVFDFTVDTLPDFIDSLLASVLLDLQREAPLPTDAPTDTVDVFSLGFFFFFFFFFFVDSGILSSEELRPVKSSYLSSFDNFFFFFFFTSSTIFVSSFSIIEESFVLSKGGSTLEAEVVGNELLITGGLDENMKTKRNTTFMLPKTLPNESYV
jgi:hypothetical protein